MTSREKEVVEIIKSYGGFVHPTKIGRQMGVSGDYAEQICRDMVWTGHLVRKGLKYGMFGDRALKASPTGTR